MKEEGSALLQQARLLLRAQDPQKARAVLEKAVAQNPESAGAWALLGDSYAQLGFVDKAAQSYQTAIKLEPQTPGALHNLGIIELNRGNYAVAVEHLSAFRRLRPQDRAVLLPLAHCYFKIGHRAEAKQALADMLVAAENSWEANFKAGQLLLAHEEEESAIAPLEKALRLRPGAKEARLSLAMAENALGRPPRVVELLHGHLDPTDITGRLLLGSALARTGRHKEAIPLLEETLQVQPKEKPAYLALAAAYSGDARTSEAIRVLRKAHDYWPEDAEVRLALSRHLLENGNPATALGILNSSTGGPRSPQEMELYANCYVALNQLEQAERVARQAVNEGSGRESSLILLANIFQLQGRNPDVIELLEQHRQRYARSAPYMLTLGISYFTTGNYSEASKLFEGAIAADPGMAQAHYLQGNTLASMGRPDLALGPYEAAVRLVPNHYLYHLHLGLVLSILGKKDRAAEHLRRSVELNGTHAPARYELAKVYAETSHDDLARDQLEEAIKIDPEFESSYYLLSQLLGRVGRREDAARMLKVFQEIQGRRHEEERALKKASISGPNR
jgi:tetratricopeptide (TPR) repeat protein